MKCPKCRVSLVTAHYEGVEIDRCPQCSGVWLDEGEITSILKAEGEEIPASITQAVLAQAKAGIPQSELDSIELCPKCESKLKALNYNYASGVIVDVCPSNHGIWLDSMELEKVQGHFEHWEKKAKEEGKKWGELAKNADEDAQRAHGDRIGKTLSKGILSKVFHRLGQITG